MENFELQEIKDTLLEHSKMLLRIESVIVDDPLTGRSGYGSRIKKLEEDSESTGKKVFWISGAMAAFALLLKEIYSKLF